MTDDFNPDEFKEVLDNSNGLIRNMPLMSMDDADRASLVAIRACTPNEEIEYGAHACVQVAIMKGGDSMVTIVGAGPVGKAEQAAVLASVSAGLMRAAVRLSKGEPPADPECVKDSGESDVA